MDTPTDDSTDRPCLRRGLAAHRDGAGFVVHDQFRLTDSALRLSQRQLGWLERFDGRPLAEIAAETGAPPGELRELADAAESLLFLHGPRLKARLSAPIREPSCIGAYAGEPSELREQVAELFTGPGGPGLPAGRRTGPSPRAILAPHMDYGRGNVTYGHAFKELAERTDASLFVIVATSHYSPAPFTLTRQHFRTPLGVMPTDSAYIDRIVAAYGPGLFDDPLAHVPEHSVELEVVLLQYLFADRPNVRIVPLLVGSFHDHIEARRSPADDPDTARMANALRAAEAAAGEPVCTIISGDLAHIGPKFGDRQPVTEEVLGHGRQRDAALLATLERADADAFFGEIAGEDDCRRICGLPPAWLTLAAARPSAGRVLHYQQFAHPRGRESVSFAGVVFEP